MAEVPYSIPATNVLDRDPVLFTLPNFSTYIVDENLNMLPVGFPGEILIGGAGVASGYLNNGELTRKKFIPDVFAPADHIAKGWVSMHKTGDRGRLRSDGALILE